MKIKLISDLHLECLSEESIRYLGARVAKDPADVLVLAGDVCPLKSKRWKRLITETQMSFKHIIWIPGNHEYYGSNFQMATVYHRKRLASFADNQPEGSANLHYLDNQSRVIDNVNFIGSTLWTDFEKGNPLVMNDCQRLMNDFYHIKYNGRLMIAHDQYELHKAAKHYIFQQAKNGSKRGNINFVISHHGPTWMSVHEDYRTASWAATNPAYVSDLSEQIMDHDIHTWVHGHTHRNFDYMMGDTRVVVNPHGYQQENVVGFDPNLILEVSTEQNTRKEEKMSYGRMPNCT